MDPLPSLYNSGCKPRVEKPQTIQAGQIFDQDNILDNIRYNHCKLSSGIGILKELLQKVNLTYL